MKLKINGNLYAFFSNVDISLKLDSVASVFSFDARFNSDNPIHKELFKPLGYQKIEFFNDSDVLVFTGTILNTVFDSDEKPHLTTVSGYSLPGILEDVTVPIKNYPLESLNRSLKDVAQRLLELFKIKLIIDPSASIQADRIYKKSVVAPTDSIKAYLSKLTSQRNVLLSHNAKGDIIIFKPVQATPKYFFTTKNTQSMKLSVSGQAMHSLISVVRQPSADNAGVSTADSIENDLISVFRPTTKVLTSGEDTDTSKAADNILADELKGIVIKVFLNSPVEIIPGEIVEVQNSEIYLYNRTKLMVASANIKNNTGADEMSLTLVLPETYTGDKPSKIFD